MAGIAEKSLVLASILLCCVPVSAQADQLLPYPSVEFFYPSQYGKWSDTAIYAGCIFPIGKHVEFNPYYEHQNLTGTSPNQQLNQLGLMLNLYFSVHED